MNFARCLVTCPLLDSGHGFAASVVCMYVFPSRFWNAIKPWRMREGYGTVVFLCV